MGASKTKNKKVKVLLKSEMTKELLNKGTNALYSKLETDMFAVKGFGVTTMELERFFISNGSTMESQFIGIFPAGKNEKNFLMFSEKHETKKSKVSLHDC